MTTALERRPTAPPPEAATVLDRARAMRVLSSTSAAKAVEFVTTVVTPLKQTVLEFFKERRAKAYALWKQENADFNAADAPLSEAEEIVERKLRDWIDRELGKDAAFTPSEIPGVTFSRRVVVQVDDPTQVPREFLVVDTKALQKLAEQLGDDFHVPGCSITRPWRFAFSRRGPKA